MQFNILIADDEISDLDSIISNIQHLIPNISIKKSLNTKDILSNIKNTDLLIISTHLNNEESFDFIKSLEEYIFNTIFLTNDAKSDYEVDRASDIGVFDFVSKPININKLKHKILHYMSIRKRELELLREKKISNSIMNTTTNPIFVTDSKKVLFSNTALLELLGFETNEAMNETFTEIKDVFNSRPVIIEDDINLLHEDKDLLNQNQSTDWFSSIKNNNQHKLFIKGNDGNDYVFVINSTLLDDGFTYIIHLKDITKEVEQQLELTNLLYTDNLTYLSNRTKLIEDLQNNTIDIQSLAIIDINSFKEINDFYGHKTGDTILKGIAELIIPMIITRENLLFYKFPSDIYCLANLDDDEEVFTNLIKEIIEEIDKKVFKIDLHEIDARVTVGMSFSKKNNKLITADLALQAAKSDHKDYLVFFDELDN
ncbi:MAG: diguanylate cyclase, partial [Campylobacteraceae bacterium]|nr:diguanylate cyclase [Campylobacteraceae bacterium]